MLDDISNLYRQLLLYMVMAHKTYIILQTLLTIALGYTMC